MHLALTAVAAIQVCRDDPSFVEIGGYPCHDWRGFNCNAATYSDTFFCTHPSNQQPRGIADDHGYLAAAIGWVKDFVRQQHTTQNREFVFPT